ncbi:MAG: right-handed parallel beta-helix repeat-containing protein, partial [Rikenellaceae bacterium]
MKRLFTTSLLTVAMIFYLQSLSARTWYVSTNGSDANNGSQSAPYLTISKAARLAIARDTILISGGTYRELVSPANGGLSKNERITYMAAQGEEVKIKGSEIVTGWERENSGVWSVKIDNEIFDNFNPFDIFVSGDWLKTNNMYHLGEIYINEKSLQEVLTLEEVATTEGSWYGDVQDEYTLITANFDQNPNKAITEYNVRPSCFFPQTTGVNFITVKGLNLSQAATQWSAPTSEQIGVIGPNWSKGWVIEECEISNSKCVGICLGKERASGHNLWTLYEGKFGYMHHGFTREIESIIKAYDLGWSFENIGSHYVHDNLIYDCGQAGIVGHLGVVNSVIAHNRIDNINMDTKLEGSETAGIKLHAAIDCIIENNYITHTRRGMWFDWQVQGAHIRNNIIDDSNKQDIWVEVTHGPTFIYNNIFASKVSMSFSGAKGLAFFNNLVLGKLTMWSSQERYTPYHYPHSTKLKGLFNNSDGDVKFYNNIFAGKYTPEDGGGDNGGISNYDEYPVYSDSLSSEQEFGYDHKVFLLFKFPVWTGGNIYYKGTKPYKNEVDALYNYDTAPKISLDERNGELYLVSDVELDHRP